MIGILLAAAASLQAEALPPASFAYFCKMTGVMQSNGKVAEFSEKKRLIALLVFPRADGSFEAAKTADPTSLLGGRSFSIFHQQDGKSDSYGAATGLPSSDPGGFAMTFHTPSESGGRTEWRTALSPITELDSKKLTVGGCMRFEGIDAPTFDLLVSSIGTPK